jgi:hypothetical protein
MMEVVKKPRLYRRRLGANTMARLWAFIMVLMTCLGCVIRRTNSQMHQTTHLLI